MRAANTKWLDIVTASSRLVLGCGDCTAAVSLND